MRQTLLILGATGILGVSGLGAQALHVTIEIKPGDAGPKRLEPGREGMVPMAVLTTPSFDAASVDPESILLGPTGTEATVFRSMLEDLDRDGDVDRLLLIRLSDLRLACTVTTLRLVGKTVSGQDIEGTAAVEMEGCP